MLILCIRIDLQMFIAGQTKRFLDKIYVQLPLNLRSHQTSANMYYYKLNLLHCILNHPKSHFTSKLTLFTHLQIMVVGWQSLNAIVLDVIETLRGIIKLLKSAEIIPSELYRQQSEEIYTVSANVSCNLDMQLTNHRDWQTHIITTCA